MQPTGPSRAPLPLSLPPKRSIFTLRPLSHTEGPPPDTETAGSPARAGRRAWLAVGAALLLVAAGAWGVQAKNKPPPRGELAPLVVINGAPQTKHTKTGHAERWASQKLTLHIDSSVGAVGPGATEAVQNAFGTWLGSRASLPSVTFDTTSGTSAKLELDGKSTVSFAPIDIPGHKNDLAITIGFVDEATGRIVEADIIINAKKPFGLLDSPPLGVPDTAEDDDDSGHESPGCNARYDLQNVVTHEAGHFFGLDEDAEDPSTTMFFKTGKCELKKRKLGEPDQSVMAQLYTGEGPEASADTDTGGGCGGASIVGRRTSPPRWTTLAMLFALVVARRPRRGATARRLL